jgi:peptide/nickel transport system permease protein
MNRFLISLSRQAGAATGALLLTGLVLLAVFAGVLFPHDPWEMAGQPMLKPFTDSAFILGTDMLGRDVAAGLVHGARVSLLVGGASTLVALMVGITLGSVAGYYGGAVDDVLTRITDFFQTIPTFVFVLVIVATLQPSIYSIVLAISVVSWPSIARLVRGQVTSLKNREFVLAAVALGESDLRIITRQILPNTLAPVMAMASLMVATAILTEAAISFLGLGDPNMMSWGYMIGMARSSIRHAWWLSFMPGFVIFLTVLMINLVGQGLSDSLDPRQQTRS